MQPNQDWGNDDNIMAEITADMGREEEAAFIRGFYAKYAYPNETYGDFKKRVEEYQVLLLMMNGSYTENLIEQALIQDLELYHNGE